MGIKMAEIEWTAESAIHLLEEYKKNRELWDSTHDAYRIQSAKYLAWTKLANTFQCDIADLRKKLNSIFASHRREKAKIRNGGHSSWFLYQYMSFLPNHLENTNSTEKIDESEQSSDNEDNEDNNASSEEEVMVKQEPVTQHYLVSEQKHGKRLAKRVRVSRPLLKRKLTNEPTREPKPDTLDSKLLETLRLLRKSDLSRKKDVCDSFGEYIAVSLRKHDDRTQSMIKQAINNILFEQEMKKYSTGQYTVVLSNDENPLILGDQDDK